MKWLLLRKMPFFILCSTSLMVFSSIDTDTLIFMVVRSSKICPSLINVPSVITQGGVLALSSCSLKRFFMNFRKILLPYFLLFKNSQYNRSAPAGIRTRVTASKGQYDSPESVDKSNWVYRLHHRGATLAKQDLL